MKKFFILFDFVVIFLFLIEKKDFTLQKVIFTIYRWLDINYIFILMFNKFWKYFNYSNIILNSVISEDILDREVPWFSVYISDFSWNSKHVFNNNYFNLTIDIIDIKEIISPKEFSEKYIKKFILSRKFRKLLKIKKISNNYIRQEYIKNLNCYRLYFVIELINKEGNIIKKILFNKKDMNNKKIYENLLLVKKRGRY